VRRRLIAIALAGATGLTLMAFNDIELRRCEQALERFLELHRPPLHLRDKCDIGYRIIGHSVVIFETAPDWVDKSKTMETPGGQGDLRPKNEPLAGVLDEKGPPLAQVRARPGDWVPRCLPRPGQPR